MTGLFAILMKKDSKAIAKLQSEVARTSNQAIDSANALQETIRGVIDRKNELAGLKLHAVNKKH